jgi:transcriptional regulator with XRE-family HTH domain
LQEAERKIGAKIRELRERAGLNQDDFARHAGINRVHLYRIETGRQSPTIRTLSIVAEALGVSLRVLFEDL